MLRVLLLIDDYNELLYLQTVLKKIGFDVEGINSQKKYSDASLGFNPQILVATARGKKVDAMAMGQTIRRVRGLPRIIALKRANVAITRDEMEASGIDLAVDSPVNIKKLVAGLAELGGVDDAGFMAKLDKLSPSGDGLTEADLNEIKSLDNLDDDFVDLKAQRDVEKIVGINDDVQIVKGNRDDSESSEIVTGETKSASPFPEKTAEAYQVSDEHQEARSKRFENYLKTMQEPEAGQFDRDRILEFNKMIREKGESEDLQQVEDERKKYVKALFTDEEDS